MGGKRGKAKIREGTSYGLIFTGVFAAALSAFFLLGCASEKGHSPIARLSIEPRYVPVNEETLVTLDGRRSCDEVDHPEGCDKSGDGSGPEETCPYGVTYQWEMDQPVQIVEGGLNEPLMRVKVTTDQPIQVILKVKDCDGDTAEVRGEIGIILPWPDASIEE
jgi:hypothetical protein